MMKNLLITIFFFAAYGVSGQLSIADDLSITGAPDELDIILEYDVVLEGQDSAWVHWEILLDEDVPKEWNTFLCDNNLCYSGFVRNTPTGSDKVNKFYADVAEKWKFHTEPLGVEGEGVITINTFFLDPTTANHTPNDFDDIEYDGDTLSMTSHSFVVKVDSEVSVEEIDLSEVSLYPNPTSDLFQVKTDEYVKAIGIYNVVGKQVQEMNHTPGQSHTVDHLKKGMYLVRLMDDNGQIIKTMKLSKR